MAYYCSPYVRVPLGSVVPHVPDQPLYVAPPRYTIVLHYRGTQSVRVIQPVEQSELGLWRLQTADGVVLLEASQVWESVEAAVDELFRQTNETSAEP
jgi:hypothetical protein